MRDKKEYVKELHWEVFPFYWSFSHTILFFCMTCFDQIDEMKMFVNVGNEIFLCHSSYAREKERMNLFFFFFSSMEYDVMFGCLTFWHVKNQREIELNSEERWNRQFDPKWNKYSRNLSLFYSLTTIQRKKIRQRWIDWSDVGLNWAKNDVSYTYSLNENRSFQFRESNYTMYRQEKMCERFSLIRTGEMALQCIKNEVNDWYLLFCWKLWVNNEIVEMNLLFLIIEFLLFSQWIFSQQFNKWYLSVKLQE